MGEIRVGIYTLLQFILLYCETKTSENINICKLKYDMNFISN